MQSSVNNNLKELEELQRNLENELQKIIEIRETKINELLASKAKAAEEIERVENNIKRESLESSKNIKNKMDRNNKAIKNLKDELSKDKLILQKGTDYLSYEIQRKKEKLKTCEVEDDIKQLSLDIKRLRLRHMKAQKRGEKIIQENEAYLEDEYRRQEFMSEDIYYNLKQENNMHKDIQKMKENQIKTDKKIEVLGQDIQEQELLELINGIQCEIDEINESK